MTRHDSAHAAPSRRAVVRDREEAVVARLRTLGTALDGEPDPQFRTATRARLVAMAAVRQPAPPPKPWLRRVFERAEDRTPSVWRSRLTAGLAGAAVAVTAFAALVAVSTGAGPGDALYALKRGTEQSQLALASDNTRGQTLLDFARNRLHELQDLARSGSTALPAAGDPAAPTTVLAAGPSTSLVLATISTMNRQTTEGTYWVTTQALRAHDPAALGHLSDWVGEQSSGLRTLTPQLPQGAQSAAGQALTLLQGIATRSTALNTSLACPAGPATSGIDQLGPVPAACPASPSVPAPGTGSANQQTGGTAATLTPGATNGGASGTPSTGGILPGTGGTGGSTGGGVGVPTLPTIPGLPTQQSGGGLPTLPGLPGLPGGQSTSPTTSSQPPLITSPSLPIQVCLPLVTC